MKDLYCLGCGSCVTKLEATLIDAWAACSDGICQACNSQMKPFERALLALIAMDVNRREQEDKNV